MGYCDKCIKGYGNYMYLLFRVLVGVMLFLHGANKFGLFGSEVTVSTFAGAMGLPVVIAFLLALVEVLAGLAIVFGFLTRLAGFGTAVIMIGAVAIAHTSSWNPLTSNGELALMYLAASIVLMLFGARKFCLETILLKNKKEMF